MKHYPHPQGIKLDNLLKMADYIETVPQHRFTMYTYRAVTTITNECDSVGCIIGHCTILDTKPLPILWGDIDFSAWSFRYTGIRRMNRTWKYLFDTEWVYVDNTPTGAAKRIRYYVANGLPENWLEQMTGKAPLSYL